MDNSIAPFRKISIVNTKVAHDTIIPIPILLWLSLHFPIIESFFSFMNPKHYTSLHFLIPTNSCCIYKFRCSRTLISPYTTHQVIIDLHPSNNSHLFHFHDILHSSTRENEIILRIKEEASHRQHFLGSEALVEDENSSWNTLIGHWMKWNWLGYHWNSVHIHDQQVHATTDSIHSQITSLAKAPCSVWFIQ